MNPVDLPKYQLNHKQFSDECLACHAVKKCNKYNFPNPVHEHFQRVVINVMEVGVIIWNRKRIDCRAYTWGLSTDHAVILKTVLNKRFNFDIQLIILNALNLHERKSDKSCLNYFNFTEECFQSRGFRHELGIRDLPEKEELFEVIVDYSSGVVVENLEDLPEEEELFVVLF